MRLAAITILLIVWGVPSGAPLRASPPLRPALSDSLDLLRDLRGAQSAFERFRRFRAPWGAGSGGRCDERVGRFCYWYDAPVSPLPEEPPVIVAERRRLLDQLAEGARALPGDDWIAGQRVRYLVEAREWSEAAEAASTCAGTAWWCAALRGYAAHGAGDTPRAEAEFELALGGMPMEERCRWNDLEPWLEGEERGRWKRLGCEERAPMAERYWRLSRPLLGWPGNDLRTEFLARRVQAAMMTDAANAHRLRFGDDYAEMIQRYGWAVRWTRSDAGFTTREPSLAGHEPRPGYAFGAGEWWSDATPPHWDLEPHRPRFRYAPVWAAGGTRPLQEVQVARFRRGDSTLVAAAWSVLSDTAFTPSHTEASLGVITADLTILAARTMGTGPAGGLMVTAPGPVQVLGVEVRDTSTRSVRWMRRAVVDSGNRTLSDPLLLLPLDVLPETVPAALQLALPSGTVTEGASVGLFWEMYDLPADGAVRIAVVLVPTGGSLLGGLGRALGLAGDRRTLSLVWEDQRSGRGRVESRAVGLDLARLDRGRYELSLEVTVPGREPATVRREVRIR